MLENLINLKVIAMAAALGLNTAEWNKPSKEMEAQVQKLADAVADISQGKAEKQNGAVNETIANIKILADKNNDKDAQYAVGYFLQQSNQQGSLEQALTYYQKAAAQNQLQAMNNYGFILAASSREPEKAKEGITWIRKAADSGLNAARRNMSQIYLRGLGGEKQDFVKAEELLVKATAEQDSEAAFALSQFYLGAGGKDKKDDEKAWKLLNDSAKLGNASALAALGSVLFDGKKFGDKTTPADPATAVKKFEELAAQNNPAGLRTMGELYESGLAGVSKDFLKALEYYARAAQGNDAVAQLRLAGYYDKGVDLDPKDNKTEVPSNAAAALELYRLAAQNNVPMAIYNVGVFYEEGRAVDRDATKAFGFFLQSAVNGFILGMQKTGVYYLNGAGTMKDPVAAAGWFTRSAQAGLPEGHLSYGIVTEMGLVPQSEKDSAFMAAADSYMQASDSLNANPAVRMEALLRLGSLYLRGALVPKGETPKPDFEKAYVNFKQAVDIDPKSQLAEQARSEVVAKLTQQQIAKADVTVEQLKKKREDSIKAEEAKAQAPKTEAAKPATPAAGKTR